MTYGLLAPADTAWRRFEIDDRGRRPSLWDAVLRAAEANGARYNLDPSAPSLAAELVILQRGLTELDQIAATLLILVTLIDVQQGSTRSPLNAAHLQPLFTGLLRQIEPANTAPPPVIDLVQRALELATSELLADILQPHTDPSSALPYKPLLVTPGWIFQHRMAHAEGRLSQTMRARFQDAARVEVDPAALDAAGEQVWSTPCGKTVLSDDQRKAALMAASRPLTFISGGPGTGKTSIVVAMLRVLVRLNVDPKRVALAAPTGKAAWRMGQSIADALAQLPTPGPFDQRLIETPLNPVTLHRLLGYQPRGDRFRHHSGRPIDAQVVVIDESSMIDVFLMERLLAATPPGARLILLGDGDQLPSVAAGAVFRDARAAAAKAGAHSHLGHSYRMDASNPAGRSILTVAKRINSGDTDLWGFDGDTALVQSRPKLSALTWRGVEQLPGDPLTLEAFFEDWFAKVQGRPELAAIRRANYTVRDGRLDPVHDNALDTLFTHLNALRILCLTRVFDTGAERANARLHALAIRAAQIDAGPPLLVGEPVMMLANDYDRQLFNGDQGVVLWVVADGQKARMAVFPGPSGYRGFHLDALGARLELAYAMTVHKSQGSEFEQVALVLPNDDLPLLTRELIYTGLTRAKRSVLLIGPDGLLTRATTRPVGRFSALAELLDPSKADQANQANQANHD